METKWEKYDPEWIIRLATEQIPDRPEIINALTKCTKSYSESRAYKYFVNGENPNEPDSEWQFQENIMLEDKKYGTIILDILTHNRVGGIEFLKFVK